MRASGMVRPTMVTVTRTVWGQDADAGRTITNVITVAVAAGSVQQDPAQRSIGEDGRLMTLIPTVFRFSDSYDLQADDLATWSENGITHSVQLEGRINRMARGMTFEYSGVERI